MDAPPPQTDPLAPHPQVLPPNADLDVEKNKDLAAFSYVYVMSVVLYVLKRNESPFIRYHSKQAMLLFGLAIIFWFVPIIGSFLELVVLGGLVYGFFNAAQGLRKDVWLIGPLSRGEMSLRQAWRQFVDTCIRLVRAFKSGMREGRAGKGEAAKPKPDPLANGAPPTTIPPDAKI